jgi:hypothetical protein
VSLSTERLVEGSCHMSLPHHLVSTAQLRAWHIGDVNFHL